MYTLFKQFDLLQMPKEPWHYPLISQKLSMPQETWSFIHDASNPNSLKTILKSPFHDAGASPSKSKMQAWRQEYDISTWQNFKSTFNSEGKRVVEIFWKQRFLIYLVCKVLYDYKKLLIGSGTPYQVITESYCNRRK